MAAITNLGQFAGAVLDKLGVPDTKANRDWLVGWAQVEGTAAKNNPLATTYKLRDKSGDVVSVPLPGNSAGVQQYATPEQGVQATAATLGGYPSIVAALKSGNILAASFQNPPGLVHDFFVWSQGPNGNPAAGLNYYNAVKVRAQGGGGGLSAADLGSYDLTGSGGGGGLIPSLSGWVGDLTGWIQGQAGYAVVYGALVMFAIVLGIIGLLRLLGVRPSTVVRSGARAAAVAA